MFLTPYTSFLALIIMVVFISEYSNFLDLFFHSFFLSARNSGLFYVDKYPQLNFKPSSAAKLPVKLYLAHLLTLIMPMLDFFSS